MSAGLFARLAALVVAVFVAAAGLVAISPTAALAAQCSQGGVSVVVDFRHGAGGGVETACNESGGGKYASAIFRQSGFPLECVGGTCGFVCKVKQAPSNANCSETAPANAYWGLFWAKKGSTSWIYSSSGVSTLNIPEGGAVAFAFQDGGNTDYPPSPSRRSTSAPPPKPQPTKTATKAPTKKATSQPASDSGSTSAKAADEATPNRPTKTEEAAGASPQAKAAKAKRARSSKQAKAKAKAKASASASARSSASESAAVAPSDEASPDVTSAEPVDSAFAPGEEQNGLPVWVPVLVVLAIAGAAGGTAWWRRRTGAP